MYFNYHAKVKRLILEGMADHYQFISEYNNISPCLLIYMKDGKRYPIRENRFADYYELLMQKNVQEKK